MEGPVSIVEQPDSSCQNARSLSGIRRRGKWYEREVILASWSMKFWIIRQAYDVFKISIICSKAGTYAFHLIL
jgi:hypothetical protein